MGTIWEQPSPSDFTRWEAKLAEGTPPAAAAKDLGFTCSAFRRANKQRHADALELSREARGAIVDTRVEQWALHPDASDSMRQFWARRWEPAYAGATKLELTGTDGGPVEITHKGGLTLSDVAAFANHGSDSEPN